MQNADDLISTSAGQVQLDEAEQVQVGLMQVVGHDPGLDYVQPGFVYYCVPSVVILYIFGSVVDLLRARRRNPVLF